MGKYIIFQKYTSYGYVVVEANNKEDAQSHIPTAGDKIILSSGFYQNVEAHPVRPGDSVMKGDASCAPETGFQLVTDKNKMKFISDWIKQFGWNPCLDVVNFDKIRKIKLPKGYKSNK